MKFVVHGCRSGAQRSRPRVGLAASLWVSALIACGWSGCAVSGPATPDGSDPVDALVAELGVAVDGCSGAGFSNGTLTLTLGSEPLLLNAPAGKFMANGYRCSGSIMGKFQPLTNTNVSKIVIEGTAGDDKVVLDFLPGTFGSKILSKTGGILIDFAATGGNDTLIIRGTASPETYRFGKSASGSDVYIDINSDKSADIAVKPGTSLRLLASLGKGNDTILCNPAPTDIANFSGTAISVVPLTTGLTAYGGPGDDKFTGGNGDDAFYGGDGNDTFKATAYPDGNDIYSGDLGTDTVDYSARSAALNIDIGPARVSSTGNADLGKLDYADLVGTTLIFSFDGGSDHTATFSAPLDPAALIAQINAAAGASVASITGKNQLTITTPTSTADSSVTIDGSSTAITSDLLDMPADTRTTYAGTTAPQDADDGQAGETDDVRSGTENITGGSGNDTLIGDAAKNVIKGGLGDDIISGGSKPCAQGVTSSMGDFMQGEAGDDTFFVPEENCYATLSGGTGTNTADFSARSADLKLSDNGAADDGVTGEKVNIGSDTRRLIGGFGADTLTGGSYNDTLIGGPGADVLIGGPGSDDIADYSAYDVPVTVTLCFASSIAGCGVGDDGAGEGDQVYMIEHLIGGSDIDTFSVLADAKVKVTLEGGPGNDVLTGGAGDDAILGQDGDDTLTGGAGNDVINGGAGIDIMDGGDGDNDVCIADDDDSPPPLNCTLSL
jgi:Ca2+-binding RTX toxin-like protein